MDALEFIEGQSFTVEQFKAAQKVEVIHVKENPKTGKLFFTYGGKTGAVSSKGIPEQPMISLVRGEEGEFFLLHQEPSGVPDVATF
jgi:hypothetical protein